MPRERICRVVESTILKYSIPRQTFLACSLERIVRMECKNANPSDVRKIVHELLKQERK